MSFKIITIPDVGDVRFYKRVGSRNIRMSMNGNGEVRVTLPKWLPYHAAVAFVESKADWINSQVKNYNPVILEHGHQVGKAHRLVLIGSDTTKISSRVLPTEIRVTHPHHLQASDIDLQDKARKASVRALKQEAEQLLPRRLRQLADFYGFDYNTVSVKPLKSRWGSCSSQQDIVLNIYLMQLPWYLIDYVLVHELTHTKIMQHGAPFWDEMEKHLPNAKVLRQEINRHQPVLAPIAPSVA